MRIPPLPYVAMGLIASLSMSFLMVIVGTRYLSTDPPSPAEVRLQAPPPSVPYLPSHGYAPSGATSLEALSLATPPPWETGAFDSVQDVGDGLSILYRGGGPTAAVFTWSGEPFPPVRGPGMARLLPVGIAESGLPMAAVSGVYDAVSGTFHNTEPRNDQDSKSGRPARH